MKKKLGTKSEVKKLTVNRETLRQLDESATELVAGALPCQSGRSCTSAPTNLGGC